MKYFQAIQELGRWDKLVRDRTKKLAIVTRRKKIKKNSMRIEDDDVLVKRMVKANKLASTIDPTVHRVVDKRGLETVVEAF